MKKHAITIIIFIGLVLLLDTAHYLLGEVFLWKGEPPSPDYQPSTNADYIFMLTSEIFVFIIAGIVIGIRVVMSSVAGLMAIALGTIYLAMEGHSGYVYYYMSSHPTAFDEFMFIAPTLAPVIFIPAATLLTTLIYTLRITKTIK